MVGKSTWKNLLNRGQWKNTWPTLSLNETGHNVLASQYLLLEKSFLDQKFFEQDNSEPIDNDDTKDDDTPTIPDADDQSFPEQKPI